MKTYTGTANCNRCGKEFQWEFLDDGKRPGMRSYYSPAYSPISKDESTTQVKRITLVPGEAEVFKGYCPHCQAPVSFSCSHDILKELYR